MEHEHTKHKKQYQLEIITISLIAVVAVLILFNQWQINTISGSIYGLSGIGGRISVGGKDVSNIDLSQLKSTGHSVAAMFPVENIKTAQDAVNVMIPTGIPDYGNALGISYDDPLKALSVLSGQVYPYMLSEIKKDQATYQRYLNLVLKPVGISCEYCCGVGPIGASKDGSSACGCQHNPALLGLTMWLMKNTDYTDAEVLREALRWKALFFPKNMVELALSVAGGDTSKLNDLPGMVGGC